jgi:hypothetical protein
VTPFLLLLLLIAIPAAFVAGYVVARRRARPAASSPPELAPPVDPQALALAHAEASPPSAPMRLRFTADAAAGTPEWRAAMGEIGERMRGAGVRLVLFAHGSFVGDDPLGLARVAEEAAPLLPEIARGLRGFTRSNVSRLLGDLSNFTDEYVRDFGQATGVVTSGFTWSGENHHAGRIQGAVRLARALVLHGGGAVRPGDRLLLVGHSHGGQVFAILSQLLARAQGYDDLLAAAHARGEDVAALEEHLALLRRCSIDVATFGTPPRYGWARSAGFRALHVVNHRGATPRAPSLRGLFHTRHGDYVHHIGAHGSDFPAPTARERAMNARLDRWLGQGSSVRLWLRNVAHGLRVAPEGDTVLVDYGDDAKVLPNLIASGLGHAAYTRYDAMLFHARLVGGHFYPPRAEEKPLSSRLRGWAAPRRLLLPARRSPSSPEA